MLKMNHFNIISEEYGVIATEAKLGNEKTISFINLIKKQIEQQALVEVLYDNANPMFHYGIRWGRLIPENKNIQPMHPSTIVKIDQFDKQKVYAYSQKDQHGNELPSITELRPIIDEIEAKLPLDMSQYDAMIGNIYLNGLFIPPHKDRSESKSATKYPIIVFCLGNDSGLGIWDDSIGNKILNSYDINSARVSYPPPTNEVLIKNGTIYTIAYQGAKRFDLLHTTPNISLKPIKYPAIQLPNTLDMTPKLRNKTITNYTITLTFRRAQDILTY